MKTSAWAVDLRPRPAQFNDRKEAALMRQDVRAKCAKVQRLLAVFPGAELETLVFYACAESVQACELEHLTDIDD